MKVLSFFLILLIVSAPSYGQDTLKQFNSHQFGFDQTYALNDNGTFYYWSRGHCTGGSSRGKGVYSNFGRKLKFEFDTIIAPKNSVNCINYNKTDSIHLFVYDALDSTRLDYFFVEDTTFLWLDSGNYKIASRGLPFRVSLTSRNLIEVELDSTCSAYQIYLEPNFSPISKGTVNVLKKKKDEYQETTIYKPKKYSDQKRHKSVYRFRYISQ
ncbi:MAG: hypothetical protein ACI8ZM_003462 [Crocinitomix sp.]|jgi:hypothetical protein